RCSGAPAARRTGVTLSDSPVRTSEPRRAPTLEGRAASAARWRYAPLLWLLVGAAPRSFAQTVSPSPGDATSAPAASARAEVLLVVVGSEHELSRLREAVATWRLGEAELTWQRSASFRPRSLLE